MIITCIAYVFMLASWCVAYRTIKSLKKELNRFKYNESHYKAVLKTVEGFFRTMDSCRGYLPNTDIGKIASVAFKHWLYVESLEDCIRSLKAENKRLQKQYLQAVESANENIAKNVDGNYKYWKDLCEKRTKMYIEEQVRANALGEQLKKEIHKPFPYIEQVNRMRVALLRQMAKRAFFQTRYLQGLPKLNDNVWKQQIRKCRQWNLFSRKADELEKELNEERSELG